MIKVSHECPKCLLEKSRSFNDYDYALVHLFDEDEDYLNFYKESLRQGRTVYLDNSAYELGGMFDHKRFAERVTELGSINSNNFYYIIPDVLRDKDGTINSFKEFKEMYPDLPGKRMGVVQGNNYEELLECFEYMKKEADMVAIGFNYKWYLTIADGANDDEKYMTGRRMFLRMLDLTDTKIHLLGCYLPQEFKDYWDIPEIVSVDTSNPIVHGILGDKYSEYGLTEKKNIKMVDMFNADITDDQLDVINHNIKVFRSFISYWIPFYTNGVSDIINIINTTGIKPVRIISNNRSRSPELADYINLTVPYAWFKTNYEKLRNCVITLHDVSSVIPKKYAGENMFACHKGLTTVFPVLAGNSPQKKAYDLGMDKSGSVIYKATFRDNCVNGAVCDVAVDISKCTLDEIYKRIDVTSIKAWKKFFSNLKMC